MNSGLLFGLKMIFGPFGFGMNWRWCWFTCSCLVAVFFAVFVCPPRLDITDKWCFILKLPRDRRVASWQFSVEKSPVNQGQRPKRARHYIPFQSLFLRGALRFHTLLKWLCFFSFNWSYSFNFGLAVCCWIVLIFKFINFKFWKQVQTLTNPTTDEFRRALELSEPNFVYLQGQQFGDEEEIHSLVWGDVHLSSAEALTGLFGATLPTTVSSLLFAEC